MEHNVKDTELTIPDRKPVDRSIPRGQGIHRRTRKRKATGHNSKCVVKKVSKEEMEKQWKE